jgi:hypothetical protein
VSHWPAVTIYLNLINDINIDIIFKPFILKINPCAKSIPRFSPPPTKFAVIGSAMVNTFRYFVVFSWDWKGEVLNKTDILWRFKVKILLNLFKIISM